MGRIWFSVTVALLLFSGSLPRAEADITVEGTVYYWNGFVRDDAAGTVGDWRPAAHTEIQVENDAITVGDITTYTDAEGKYKATFAQRFFRPDFGHLRVIVEVRARVRMRRGGEGTDDDTQDATVACFKTKYLLGRFDVGGPVRLYPYNGQTSGVDVKDGETRIVDVYVGPSGCPAPPASSEANMSHLRITAWDYDDNGTRTTAAIFLCQSCLDLYKFLVSNCARRSELNRNTSIFYPARKSAYVFKPDLGAWIDMASDDLFKDEEARREHRWAGWQELRCTMLHEFSHKLMHDVYWTLPKPYPWGHALPLTDENHSHDLKTCTSGEMGLCEGWAHFLPAVLNGKPTVKGKRVFQGVETVVTRGVTVSMPTVHPGENIEHAWFPGMPGITDADYLLIPGDVSWRNDIDSRRDWNEAEVAAVLWDIADPVGWEYMPAAQQQYKREGWPAHLRWNDRLSDSNLERIWAIVREEPECLNDEEEMGINQDSLWTFWLEKHQNDLELVHGLKAILNNREMSHALRPENAPAIDGVRLLPPAGEVQYAAISVREIDPEDRSFLFYNVAYGPVSGSLQLMHAVDQPLQGTWNGEQLSSLVRLPRRCDWGRVMILVHDSMACNFIESGDAKWSDASATGPRVRLLSAGGNHAMAFRCDGTVWTWGEGPLRGDKQPQTTVVESLIRQKTATAAANLPTMIAVAAGNQHSMALGVDGTVWTWGYNYGGDLGIGEDHSTRHRSDEPVRIDSLGPVVAVAAGWNRSFAVLADGKLWGWGSNANGELGDGTKADRAAPVHVANLPRMKAVATGGRHTLAVDQLGNAWAWGCNDMGQLGDGTTEDRLVPVRVQGIQQVVDVAVQHGSHSLALRSDGTVWEWGARKDPQRWAEIDHYRRNWVKTLNPQPVPGLDNVVAIVSGNSHSLALRRDGTVFGWGGNHNGELGDGTTRSRWPIAPVNDLANVVAIAAGGIHSAAVKSDGTVWSWGGRTLGNHMVTRSTTPVEVNTYSRLLKREPNETIAAFQYRDLRLFD